MDKLKPVPPEPEKFREEKMMEQKMK